MATLKDIADRAGVSVETVSRVLNGKNKEVWPSAVRRAEAIRTIARKAGFRPNSAARTMRRGRFRQIACVVTRFAESRFGRDMDRSYLEAATMALAQKRYSAIFEPFLLDWRTMDLVEDPRLFSELAVDGILGIVDGGLDLRHIDRKLASLGCPAVWVNRDPVPNIPCIVSDEVANARLLTRYFIDRGHRAIGYLGYPAGHYSVEQRHRGVVQTLNESGLDTSHVVLKQDDGHVNNVVRQFFDGHRSATALICYNGQFYDAVLHEAASRGIRIPGDLAIGYFGSTDDMALLYPVVVLAIPKREMAVEAVGILLDLIDGRPAPNAPQSIPGKLVLGPRE